MKFYLVNLALSFLILLTGINISDFDKPSGSDLDLENKNAAMVSYDDFKDLVRDVEDHRSKRLVSLDQFLELSQKENTIILDTRAKDKYIVKHVKGAKHLAFTEFTMGNLANVIPNKETNILIYCNNNFKGDPHLFASKVFTPKMEGDLSIMSGQKPITLALNIPTYLNLYGYGYHNVYELNELVDMDDPRITFDGRYTKNLKLR